MLSCQSLVSLVSSEECFRPSAGGGHSPSDQMNESSLTSQDSGSTNVKVKAWRRLQSARSFLLLSRFREKATTRLSHTRLHKWFMASGWRAAEASVAPHGVWCNAERIKSRILTDGGRRLKEVIRGRAAFITLKPLTVNVTQTQPTALTV